jgi:4-oxalmesaconate hydratase
MIIDVHGHYTTAPAELGAYRAQQLLSLNRPSKGNPPPISDDQLGQSMQGQLKQMSTRGIDLMCFSPQASAMGHDIGDALVSLYWTQTNNDLIARVCQMFPDQFVPVCQLPQSPEAQPADSVSELDRCVQQLGFVGCNINPDASGGLQPWTPPLGDRAWYPLWEKMCELDVPGMIHASSTRNPAMHVNGSHYVAQDYAAVVELTSSKVFENFPQLRLIIPHGGGAIPYQFNRHRALHAQLRLPPFEEAVRPLYFDTSLYDADSLEMLVRKIGADRVLFGSEMFGTASSTDPRDGVQFDDNRRHIEKIEWLSTQDKEKIYEKNARQVFPRASAAFDRTQDHMDPAHSTTGATH